MRLSKALVIAVSFVLSAGSPCFGGDPYGIAELVAYGPSPDCKKVSGAAETMLCTLPKLRDMDQKLEDQWVKIAERLDKQAQTQSVAARKEWRSRLRTDCERSLSDEVDKCIRRKFEERQSYLTTLAKGNVAVIAKSDSRNPSDSADQSSPKDDARSANASNDMAGKAILLKMVRCSLLTLSESSPTERCADHFALVSILRGGYRFDNLDCKKNGKTYAPHFDKSATDGVATLTCRTDGNTVSLLREETIYYKGVQIRSASLQFMIRSRNSCELTGYSRRDRMIWMNEDLLRVVREHRLQSATSCRIYDSYEEALANIRCDAKSKYCEE
ncbi:hypothetical protein JQ561_09030 [Bradyrhizobium diazoefficiens]|uniref:hypothetical protein n=1 Tax=Bradyrhizobium sp. WYCCWR 12699 TaxID=3064203 RepID=UPI001BA8F33C|nr:MULTISPECIES: hypothetical protein [Bradyrhizobium]MBR0926748.1 hypothetical protein [Bradyrhizobium diazoefficiens]MDT4739728.1 hypothetical protein [Bradyrhizobium sp. WYCCWR 12699]